jgi:hypothetical protein
MEAANTSAASMSRMLLAIGRSLCAAHAPAPARPRNAASNMAKRTSFGVMSQLAATKEMTATPSNTPPSHASAVAASSRRASGMEARMASR